MNAIKTGKIEKKENEPDKEKDTQGYINAGKDEKERDIRAASKFVFTGVDGKVYKITLRQKLFAEYFLEFDGRGTDAVYEAGYQPKDRNSAGSIAHENLMKLDICAYITTLLDNNGFNDENVQNQHLFLINQYGDMSAKSKGVDLYYKVKNRYPAERVIDETAREQLEAMRKDIKEWIGAK